MPASKPVPRVSIAETLFYFPQYYKNYLGGLEYLRKTKGDAFSFTFPKKTLFLMNPSHVDAVLIKNAKHFRKSDNYKADLGLLGNSLLTTEGEEWRRKRKAIAPEFHLTQISKFDDLFLKKSTLKSITGKAKNASMFFPICSSFPSKWRGRDFLERKPVSKRNR